MSFRRSDAPWGETYWRGVAYAQLLLNLEKPVVVKITPPRDKRTRERLRYLIEGTTVGARGRRYRVGGLLKRIGGEKLAPWIYLIPKKKLAEFHQTVRRSSHYRFLFGDKAEEKNNDREKKEFIKRPADVLEREGMMYFLANFLL
ncbi:MAG: hypothetical protein J7L11_01240 [Thermoprotei archaeon]|nr:hypothetical protein [Thermoprotei archaeon]